MSTRARLLTARKFFEACHDDQTYGPFPYVFHLDCVVDVGNTHVSEDMLMWAELTREEFTIILLGHDSLEDTSVTRGMIEALWGRKVGAAIWSVTDVEGKDRHERKWGSPINPGPMLKLQHNRAGLLAKLCDRFANGTASKAARDKLPPHQQKKGKFEMYQKEQREFYDTLYCPDDVVLQSFWDDLNTLLEFTP